MREPALSCRQRAPLPHSWRADAAGRRAGGSDHACVPAQPAARRRGRLPGVYVCGERGARLVLAAGRLRVPARCGATHLAGDRAQVQLRPCCVLPPAAPRVASSQRSAALLLGVAGGEQRGWCRCSHCRDETEPGECVVLISTRLFRTKAIQVASVTSHCQKQSGLCEQGGGRQARAPPASVYGATLFARGQQAGAGHRQLQPHLHAVPVPRRGQRGRGRVRPENSY